MKILKKVYRMFATENVIEDVSFVAYLLLMTSVGLYTLSLTATKEIMIMCVSMLALLIVTTVIFALVQQEEE
ncbi:hypothetical protein ACFSY7_03555 [Kurthia populi]|uniref:DUF1056 domain-containing protein n=1 Tax=Kurthia populi TaxID=1562132 RepID=A0ABW5XX63_9BACL